MEVKCIMKLIRSCIVSFSMYSKIPMPQFKWNDDDMKYMLVFPGATRKGALIIAQ